MKLIERRIINASELRKLCIENNWYTEGDIEEYSHLLLELASNRNNLTKGRIAEIVDDIIAHSDTDETFESVAYKVLEISHTFLYREED